VVVGERDVGFATARRFGRPHRV